MMRVLLIALLLLSGLSVAGAGETKWKVVLLGDSTVQNYAASSTQRGWGQQLPSFFSPEVTFINLAMGGRSTKTFIQEGRLDNALSQKADVALVQFGHNDSHAKNQPESTDAATDYMQYLEVYADRLQAAGTAVIFVTPPHRRVFDAAGKLTAELAPYAQAMKTVAARKKIPVIDLYAATGEIYAQKGEVACVPLFVNEKDRTHFSREGADLLAAVIARALLDQQLPLGKLVDQAKLPTAAQK